MDVVKGLAASLLLLTAFTGTALRSADSEPITQKVHGYHFHTYFFQDNARSRLEALHFRDLIQAFIDGGLLSGCRLNHVNLVPRGPHPIGSYETCCNQSAISPALSWFMQNHGNLSVLLHPLTRWEVKDHTTRAMFLGPTVPLDLSALAQDLGDNLDLCLPINLNEQTQAQAQPHARCTLLPFLRILFSQQFLGL